MYLAIKHLHITCVALSLAGFLLRGLWMCADSPLLYASLTRRLPHIVDALLLGSAIALAVMSGQAPFVQAWLTAKVAGLLVYIVLGALALRPGRPKPVRLGAFGAALVSFSYIVSVALTKNPAGWLAMWG
ncbi:MAG TPA: SirB2 family protein [Zoogloea sp.]|uniref:SirB2 family protein n=1 Tax=Zoogloea sp. TaxID=49181 RepID=UPI002BDE76B1|nr:SirB2 family protein [Zoogloea sp.]HMV16523.1 SirB2 family protein [Rhodocyclaceae bacterium]HMV63604.1 SirB2 family protein [Rhodocyclaceae bacterium]HMW50623.1 SirB2 family protein [Rhodocyclaceae bacterium]HMY48792.1 SirB2 family protein [Rhodocyclaceae bacterium]HMZ75011.1 SirB2 family protein [Rhodocyclaceae bacterium]